MREWLRPRLLDAWETGSAGGAAIDEHRYVQWAGYSFGLQVECVGNRFLPPGERLTAQDRRELRQLGFEPPIGEDLPNYWRSFFNPSELDDAVDLLHEAVRVLQRGGSQRRRASTVVAVVPVLKGTAEIAVLALAGILNARSGTRPVAVLDVLGVPQDELPGRETTLEALTAEAPAEVYDARDDDGSDEQTDDVFRRLPLERYAMFATDYALRIAADAVAAVQGLAETGRDVVVVGPWFLPLADDVYATGTAPRRGRRRAVHA